MPTQPEAERLLDVARTALARGDRILHLQLEVSRLGGGQSSWGASENVIAADETVGYFLGEVEELGWRLEQTGYAFVETGATTSSRVFGTGEGVVNRGAVMGFYVFRRA